MPKDKSSRSTAPFDIRAHPYKPRGKGSDSEERDVKEDWEDAVCPICLEFPHNAVLLLCSSYDKGCRPYICDTSYRHSNCLDQYTKAQTSLEKLETPRHSNVNQPPLHIVLDASSMRGIDLGPAFPIERASRRSLHRHVHVADSPVINVSSDSVNPSSMSAESSLGMERSRRDVIILADSDAEDTERHNEGLGGALEVLERPSGAHQVEGSSGDVKELLCPFCRGMVSGWKVVEAARKHLNGRSRSCSNESCRVEGTYEELRLHARCDHPAVRPSEVDPARQRAWRCLERRRDMGDILSSIRSAIPGATLFGDYVIEDDIDIDSDHVELFGDDERQWWRVFFLFQFFGPSASVAREGSITSRIRGHQQRQQRRMGAARLRHWMENLHPDGREEDHRTGSNGQDHEGEIPRRPRSQRRHWGDVS